VASAGSTMLMSSLPFGSRQSELPSRTSDSQYVSAFGHVSVVGAVPLCQTSPVRLSVTLPPLTTSVP
jgi:hypothetical protein